MSQGITETVQSLYGKVATSGLSSNQLGVRGVAEAFGYSEEELSSIPAEANMGLSCGNPIAFAGLRPGEVVVDLGSGGGLDVFLAARKVGPTGKAIGIDMTPEMIALAKKNAQKGPDGKPIANVEFHLGRIDKLPLADASVDVIISNCVINLATDKRAVFREMFRVLKPGGRVAVSDISLKKPLPPEIASDLMAYVGCIAGAITIDEFRTGLSAAGFAEPIIQDAGSDLNAYSQAGASGCCAPSMTSSTGLPIAPSACGAPTPAFHASFSELLKKYDVNDYAASIKVFVVKSI
jgi:SAM-dependent methyltransferase